MANGDPTLDQLKPRGTPADTDLIPTLPAGGQTLMNQTVGALRAGVLNSVAQFGAVDPTGVADSTAAFQAAIASGQSFTIPPGVFKISANLALNASANSGQTITGAGPTDNNGLGTGKTILRPTSAVTALFTIDGTPFSGFVQSFGFAEFTVDLTHVSDLTANAAFVQSQAYDGRYSGVRVINYGVNNASWQFNTGAYTTQLRDCAGGAVRFNGTTVNNAVTTISLINCDILSIGGNYHVGVTLVGGAVQQPSSSAVPITYVAPGITPYAYSPNTAGIYVAALTTLQNCISFTSIGTDWENGGGFPTTYNDGTHGTLPLICVLKVQASAQDTTFITPGFAGMYVLDSSTTTSIIGQNISVVGGDITSRPSYHLGTTNILGNLIGFTNLANYLNTNTTITFQISASTGSAQFTGVLVEPATDSTTVFQIKASNGNQIVDVATGSGTGDFLFNNGCQVGGYTDNATTQTWGLLSTTGALSVRSALIRPGTDGNSILQLENAAGASVFTVGTNSTVENSGFLFGNGVLVTGYSDAYSTQTWQFSCATGALNCGTIVAKPAHDGNALVVQNAAGTDFFIAYSASTVAASTLNVGNGGSLVGFSDSFSTQTFSLNGATGAVRTLPTVVASLPAAATAGAGSRLFVSDSNATASGNFGAVVAGSGSNYVPVYSDGTNWRIG
jgi:hypothetical protein